MKTIIKLKLKNFFFSITIQHYFALCALSIEKLPEIDLDSVACLKCCIDLTATLRNQ